MKDILGINNDFLAQYKKKAYGTIDSAKNGDGSILDNEEIINIGSVTKLFYFVLL